MYPHGRVCEPNHTIHSMDTSLLGEEVRRGWKQGRSRGEKKAVMYGSAGLSLYITSTALKEAVLCIQKKKIYRLDVVAAYDVMCNSSLFFITKYS